MKFYSDTTTINSNNLLLVSDNAAIHKTKRVLELLESKEVRLLTFYQYSPLLNPIEGFISSIKKKIRTKLESGKILTETIIKNLIIEASIGDPTRFVKISQSETQKVICRINEKE